MELVIEIPNETYKKIEDRVEQSEFESIDEYISFVMKEVAREDPALQQGATGDNQNVRDRLESLGYLE